MTVKNKGIYFYLDTKTNKIDYIGKDSNINNNTRHRAHLCESYKKDQPFNRILQNNPERWKYGVFCIGDFSDSRLEELENIYKQIYNPRFDFEYTSHGGLTEEHKKKISEAMKGHKHTENTRKKMSENHWDVSGKNNPKYRHDLPSDEKLFQEWTEGMTQKQLAEKYNAGVSTIQRRLKKYKNSQNKE